MEAWSLDLRLGGWAIHEEKASIFHPEPCQELTGEGARNSCPGPFLDWGVFVTPPSPRASRPVLSEVEGHSAQPPRCAGRRSVAGREP